MMAISANEFVSGPGAANRRSSPGHKRRQRGSTQPSEGGNGKGSPRDSRAPHTAGIPQLPSLTAPWSPAGRASPADGRRGASRKTRDRSSPSGHSSSRRTSSPDKSPPLHGRRSPAKTAGPMTTGNATAAPGPLAEAAAEAEPVAEAGAAQASEWAPGTHGSSSMDVGIDDAGGWEALGMMAAAAAGDTGTRGISPGGGLSLPGLDMDRLYPVDEEPLPSLHRGGGRHGRPGTRERGGSRPGTRGSIGGGSGDGSRPGTRENARRPGSRDSRASYQSTNSGSAQVAEADSFRMHMPSFRMMWATGEGPQGAGGSGGAAAAGGAPAQHSDVSREAR
eukprot:SAG22_NODE_1764_length_3626_cov_2.854551_1_plen_334_part_10